MTSDHVGRLPDTSRRGRGPWSYDSPGRGEPASEDKAWVEETIGANGAVIAGRGTYEAAGHWGGKNPGAK
jgi:dihydrofolate reductase